MEAALYIFLLGSTLAIIFFGINKIVILKKPNTENRKLKSKLSREMGHNYYGEPAWPNDLLYIFPICILGSLFCCIGLAILEPTTLAKPFAIPLEILPEWYFFRYLNYLVLFQTGYWVYVYP